jgi:hypothetical protein
MQIYALRELHEELAALLSQEEASALGMAAVFAPFAKLAALHVSDFTAAAWASALAEHERRIEGVEARVSQKLKELFGKLYKVVGIGSGHTSFCVFCLLRQCHCCGMVFQVVRDPAVMHSLSDPDCQGGIICLKAD